jgi:hypothetical protein
VIQAEPRNIALAPRGKALHRVALAFMSALS